MSLQKHKMPRLIDKLEQEKKVDGEQVKAPIIKTKNKKNEK